jgi:hypothetical protein
VRFLLKRAIFAIFSNFRPLEGYKLCRFCIISCNPIKYVDINQISGESCKYYGINTHFLVKNCVFFCSKWQFLSFSGYIEPLKGYKVITFCIISCNSIEYVNINQIFGNNTNSFPKKFAFWLYIKCL